MNARNFRTTSPDLQKIRQLCLATNHSFVDTVVSLADRRTKVAIFVPKKAKIEIEAGPVRPRPEKPVSILFQNLQLFVDELASQSKVLLLQLFYAARTAYVVMCLMDLFGWP